MDQSERKLDLLNEIVLSYLLKNGYKNSYDSFYRELNIASDFDTKILENSNKFDLEEIFHFYLSSNKTSLSSKSSNISLLSKKLISNPVSEQLSAVEISEETTPLTKETKDYSIPKTLDTLNSQDLDKTFFNTTDNRLTDNINDINDEDHLSELDLYNFVCRQKDRINAILCTMDQDSVLSHKHISSGYAANSMNGNEYRSTNDERQFLLRNKLTKNSQVGIGSVLDNKNSVFTHAEVSSLQSENNYDFSMPFFMKNKEKLAIVGHKHIINQMVFHPTQDLIATSSDESIIRLWDTNNGRLTLIFKGHTKKVNKIALTEKGDILVSCSLDCSIRVWSIAKKKCIHIFNGHEDSVTDIIIINETMEMVSCGKDRIIRVWCLKTMSSLTIFNDHITTWAHKIAVDNTNQFLAAGLQNNEIEIFDFKDGNKLKTLKGHTNQVECVIWRKNENSITYLISGGRDNLIIIWNTVNYEIRMKLDIHTNWIKSIIIHPESDKVVLTCSDDGYVAMVNINTGKCLKMKKAHIAFCTCTTIHPYKPLIATAAADRSLRIWDCFEN